MLTSGISELLRDARLVQGSKIEIGLCHICGSVLCYHDLGINRWICPTCGAHPQITPRYVPPAANLVNHILQGLHVGVEYIPQEKIGMYKTYKPLISPPTSITPVVEEQTETTITQ